ncbi:MAG: NAD(P)-dependent alcohol dehydrogenase [Bdellovibrionota bacterium]
MKTLKNTMQAVSCPRYGNHKNIIVTEKEIPTPGKKEILVRVVATAITTADTMMRSGTPKFGRLFLGFVKPKNPFLGTGYSGEIISVGTDVRVFKPGDLIFGESGLSFGANAEYVCVDSDGVLFEKPDYLSHEQASCLCDGPLTSYNFIKEVGRAQKGDKILINGGAGSLGTAAIQIAKRFGCHVVATSSKENFEFLRELGADSVIDYQSEQFRTMNADFDIVYDAVGKLKFSNSQRLLANDGKFISPVMSLNLFCSIFWQKFTRNKMIAKFSATGLKKPSELVPHISNLLDLIQNKGLKIHIEKTFSLAQVANAHGLIDAGHKRGNFIAKVSN